MLIVEFFKGPHIGRLAWELYRTSEEESLYLFSEGEEGLACPFDCRPLPYDYRQAFLPLCEEEKIRAKTLRKYYTRKICQIEEDPVFIYRVKHNLPDPRKEVIQALYGKEEEMTALYHHLKWQRSEYEKIVHLIGLRSALLEKYAKDASERPAFQNPGIQGTLF